MNYQQITHQEQPEESGPEFEQIHLFDRQRTTADHFGSHILIRRLLYWTAKSP
jgi:hypothetical protein